MSADAPRIRPAAPADAPALTACIAAAYAPHMARIPDLPPVTAGIAEDIATQTVLVAERSGRVVGGVVLVAQEDALLIANLAVDPEAAGQGLGRALMATAEAECRRHGLPELHLTTHAAMTDTIAFYTRLGWVEAGRSGNKLRMRKPCG